MLRQYDGKTWIRENGYSEEVEHILQMRREGQPLFFKGREWLDYMILATCADIEDEEVNDE